MSLRPSLCLPLLATLLLTAVGLTSNAAAQEPATDEDAGYLGVIADDQRTEGQGVRLLKVLPGGPAEIGGLEVADLITSINDKQVRTMQDMAEAIVGTKVGDELQFEVVRREQPQMVIVTLGRRPPPEERRFPEFGEIPADATADSEMSNRGTQLWLGVRAVDATPEVQRRLNRPGLSGAEVTEVIENSPAAEAGLEVGTVIVSLNDAQIGGSRDLIDAVRTASPSGEHTMGYYNLSGTLVRNNVPLRARGNPSAPAEVRPRLAPDEPGTFDLPSPDAEATAVPSEFQMLEERVTQLEVQLDRIELLLQQLLPAAEAEPPLETPVPLEAPIVP